MTEFQHLATIYWALPNFESSMKAALLKPKNLAKVHWRECGIEFLTTQLTAKADEVERKVLDPKVSAAEITELCVDIGNYAMFIQDHIKHKGVA